jgi:O-acetylhomoserine (thiol)-lyase
MKDQTIAIHGGYETEATTHAVATPIYQTVAFEFDNAQHGADLFNLAVPGNIYSRIMNPTNDVLEKRVTLLENGVGALALSAGSAAVHYSIINLAQAGDKHRDHAAALWRHLHVVRAHAAQARHRRTLRRGRYGGRSGAAHR